MPKDMSYKQWKDTVTNDFADNKIKTKFSYTLDTLTRNRPPVSLAEIETKHKDDILNTIDKSPEVFRKLIYANQDGILFAKINARGISRYNHKYGIFINLDVDYSDPRGKWTTLFHEMGHCIDRICGYTSKQEIFLNSLKTDFFVFTNSYSRLYNISEEESYVRISKWLTMQNPSQKHIISDLFGALSKNKCTGRYRHFTEYWKTDDVITKEAFAHFFSVSVCNDNTMLADIKSVFPRAYSEFIKIVEGIK